MTHNFRYYDIHKCLFVMQALENRKLVSYYYDVRYTSNISIRKDLLK